MAYRPRGSSWLVDVSHKGIRRTATCESEEEAKATEAQLRADLLAGRPTAPKEGRSWSLGKASDTAWTEVWRDSKSGPEMDRQRQRVERYWGRDTLLHAIIRPKLLEWVEWMKQRGNSNGTINRNLACLSKIMTVAVDHGGLASKPKFPRQREGQGRIRYLTEDEETALINLLYSWGRKSEAEATIVLIDTGMRVSELWRLQGRDVDFGTGVIMIWETKTSTPRSVPMTSRVKTILRRRDTGPGQRFFSRGSHSWYRNTWDRARCHLGYAEDTQFVPHMLRHTCASRLVQRGISIPVVQQWLGHKTLSVTMRYSHLSPDNLLAAASVLEKAPVSEVA